MKIIGWACGAALFTVLSCGAKAQDEPRARETRAALLPVRAVNGSKISIDAGFGAFTLGHRNPYDLSLSSGFQFSARISDSTRRLYRDGEIGASESQFVGLFEADGAPITNFSQVSPLWENVRADFMVRNPDVPDAAVGESVTPYQFQNIALPAVGQTKTEFDPVIGFVSPHGVKVTLTQLTRPREGDVRLSAQWKVERPPGASDANVDFGMMRIGLRDGAGADKAANFGREGIYLFGDAFTFKMSEIPDGAIAVNFAFNWWEEDKNWRQPGAFDRVAVDVPVAALWKLHPLQTRPAPWKTTVARTDDFEASWESIASGVPDAFTYPGVLWLRDPAPAADGTQWRLFDATIRNSKGEAQSLFNPWKSELQYNPIFHSDNRMVARGEEGSVAEISDQEAVPQRADVTLTIQRADTLRLTHVLKDVPLPAPGQSLEFERGQFFDGVWNLRRVLYIPFKVISDQQVQPSRISLTFERPEDTSLPKVFTQIWGKFSLFDQKGEIVGLPLVRFSEGDLDGELKPKTPIENPITMEIVGAGHNMTKWSANFRTAQRLWFGEQKTLVLPDVWLRPSIEKTAPR